MGQVPKPPIVARPITKTIGVGRDPDLQRTPKFSVLHTMIGTLAGTDGYFRLPDTPALTDFGIGLADAGGGRAAIYQWNDPFGRQIGWASGPVLAPQGDGPACLAAFGGAQGLNRYGVSIELDDAGNKDTPVSAAQWSALVWLLAYIHGAWLGQSAATFQWNCHHREFCGSSYKDCPHPRVYDHTDEYQAAVKAVLRHWQEGLPYPPGGVAVNGLTLTLPTLATPADPGFPGIVQPDGSLKIGAIVVPDGRATRAERLLLQVLNDTGQRFWIEWANGRWRIWLNGPIPLPVRQT